MLFYSFLSALDTACLSIAFPFNSSSSNSSAKSVRRKGAGFNFLDEGIILSPGKTFQNSAMREAEVFPLTQELLLMDVSGQAALRSYSYTQASSARD